MASNPFAALTAIVAPAILTSASSVLALGTSNRLGRVVDRTRVVAGNVAGEGYFVFVGVSVDQSMSALGSERSHDCDV